MPWPPEKETNPKYEEQKCPEDSKNTLKSHFWCLFSAFFGRDRVHTTMGQVGLGNPFNHGNTLGKLKNWCHKKSVVPWDSMLKAAILRNFLRILDRWRSLWRSDKVWRHRNWSQGRIVNKQLKLLKITLKIYIKWNFDYRLESTIICFQSS